MKPRHMYNQLNDSVSSQINVKQEDTNQKNITMPNVVKQDNTKNDITMPAVKNDPKPKKQPEVKKDIPQIAVVNVDLVNVRKAAKADADILGTVVKNAEFKVNKNNTVNGFVCIRYNGVDGYIREDLVNVIDNPAYISNTVRKL